MRRIRAIVTGWVQGVSYRASAAAQARMLELVGWVRNCEDGSVELEAEGSGDRIAAMLAWCHEGPPAARVDGVAVEEQAVLRSEHSFGIRL